MHKRNNDVKGKMNETAAVRNNRFCYASREENKKRTAEDVKSKLKKQTKKTYRDK